MDFSQLSPASQKVADMAIRMAWKYQSGYVGVEHVFLGLLTVGGADVNRVFAATKLEPQRLEKVIAAWLRDDRQRISADDVVFSPRVQSIFREATLKSARFAERTQPVHLLYAILLDQRAVPTRVLNAVRSRAEENASTRLLRETERLLELRRATNQVGQECDGLGSFAVEVTPGRIIGHSDIFKQLATSLVNCCRPMLVGEDGIGKASLFRGFVDWIASEDGDIELKNSKFYRITDASLRFGLNPEGDHLQQLSEFFKRVWMDDEIVLVIEELPQILDDSLNQQSAAAKALRQVLQNGTIRCISTASLGGFTRFEKIEPVLLRKFSPIAIEELAPEQVFAVLANARADLESFHDTSIEDDSLSAAIDLSVKFLPDYRLPGKAVDLLDQACAWELLTGLRPQELVDESEPLIAAQSSITPAKVAEAVARTSGVGLDKILAREHSTSESVAHALEQRLAGQESAIGEIAQVYARSTSYSKARAVMVFHGPPGVGKSEAAKTLSAHLSGRDDMMLNIDLGDYEDERGVEELFGLCLRRGVRREGIIAAYLRKSPWGLISLDGADRSDQKVLDKFAEILRDGFLELSSGQKTIIEHQSFVFTCQSTGPGARAEIKSNNLLALVDAVVAFDFLTTSELRELLDLRLKKVRRELSSYGLELQLGEGVEEEILSQGSAGARALKRCVDGMLLKPISEKLSERSAEASAVLVETNYGTPGKTSVSFKASREEKS